MGRPWFAPKRGWLVSTLMALLFGVNSGAGLSWADGAGGTKVDFAKEIGPIFTRSCLECHGPEKQKAGLRLDRKADAFAGGDSGQVMVPGNSGESELIARVTDEDPDLVMPPKGDRLTTAEVARLRQWIDQGANWPDEVVLGNGPLAQAGREHWAFKAIKRPEIPKVQGDVWMRNPIDAFVLAKLEGEGVDPAGEANRATLIRRLSLDLLGLPPTPVDVETFEKDTSANAYERVVDRFLNSPHFGERWGRHWLDLARYADSDGYEKDSPRPFAYRYRDWVINAFNRDLPFDQFTIEQLAGDLLPGATLEQRMATGFHRNTLTNKEGGTDPEEFRVAAVVDRTNTTGTVWLGLTVGCAQCHTHKYDPILQKEYYSLFAFFNGSDEKDLPAPIPGEVEAYQKAKTAHDADHKPLVDARDAYDRDGRPERQLAWEESVLTQGIKRWEVLTPAEVTSERGVSLDVQPDQSVLATGLNPDLDVYRVVVNTALQRITGFRVEVLSDPKLPSSGPGRVKHGNFVLNEFQVDLLPRGGRGVFQGQPVALRNASADFAQEKFLAEQAIDGKAETGWAISPQFGKSHVAVFETQAPTGFEGGGTLVFTLDQRYGKQHTIGRFRILATTSPGPHDANDLPEAVAKILVKTLDERTKAETKRVAEYHRTVDPEWLTLNEKVVEHAKLAPKAPSSVAPTLADRPGGRTTKLLVRGDFLRPGDEVTTGTPAVLTKLRAESDTPTRLDLARWLMDVENPLTSRVTVNRMWRHLFGRPLVMSVEDFGTRGEKPSHPELLDWLASEFPRMGWSQKAMIKLMVMSSAYRQSSANRPELLERDPLNAWLARQNRFRPEAEIMRDSALAASGLLQPRVGGPSVRPPQPPGISDLTYAGSAKWVDSQGADRYRRGMYTWFQRTSPYPMLMTFDAPDANVCVAKRERSNTPLQALTLLNDAVFVECAQAMGRRIVQESCCESPLERARYAFRLCLARDLSRAESEVLVRLHDDFAAAYKAQPEEAEKLADAKDTGPEERVEMAAWTAIARMLMNLDEFITRE